MADNQFVTVGDRLIMPSMVLPPRRRRWLLLALSIALGTAVVATSPSSTAVAVSYGGILALLAGYSALWSP